MMSTRPSPTPTAVTRPSTPARPSTPWTVPVLSLTSCLIACATLAACHEASSIPPGPARFTEHIAPLAAERCDSCHAQAPGGPMAVYSTARSLITPGKPDESLYYTLPKGHPAAWGDAAGRVRAWIEAGAPE
jgi:hypothetical protein